LAITTEKSQQAEKPETQAPQQITPLSADRWEKLHWLWAFLDEALLDYEDCLMATDPELKRELEARLREETVPFEELWLAVFKGAGGKPMPKWRLTITKGASRDLKGFDSPSAGRNRPQASATHRL
jgi:hypothetical protein